MLPKNIDVNLKKIARRKIKRKYCCNFIFKIKVSKPPLKHDCIEYDLVANLKRKGFSIAAQLQYF